MGTPKIPWTVVLLLGCTGLKFAAAGCGFTLWSSDPDHSCATYVGWDDNVEVFKDTMPNGETTQTNLHIFLKNYKVAKRTKGAISCGMSPCTTTPVGNNCQTRTVSKKSNKYVEIPREKCSTEDEVAGYTSLCCPKGSMEGQLASVYGAEPHEFPHIAKLLLPGHCGGTIYNKRFIITAAHCVTDKDTYRLDPASEMKAITGSNSGDNEDKKYVYKVEKVIPHPEYSRLYPNSDTMSDKIVNDIALLKLKRDIKFGPNVKALRIVQPDFEPRDYADQAIIAGWGTTDTLEISAHLQKANFLLRDPKNCFDVYNSSSFGLHQATHSDYKDYQDQLLCVGGVLEGKWSPTAGGGDSSGPAVCRDQNGQAALCGVTSFGGDDEACLKQSAEEGCPPSIYARVSHFHNWIKKHAGDPADEEDIFKPYLYGQPLNKGKYDHQVRITSDKGKSCGGTLVSQDVVITAASCIAKEDGTGLSGVKVHYGLNDVKNGKPTKSYDIAGAAVLPGFKRVREKVDVKQQGDRIRITENFYKNDLADIKIKGKAPISVNKLPGLPGVGDMFEEGREIAFPRKTHHGGKLFLREFLILDKNECQKRMTRLAKGEETMGGQSMKFGGDIFCGVEKYSGGSLCDRELGGGLICKGANGKDVLCGVQIFRLCEWSIPNAFMEMAQKSGWVKKAMKQL